MYSNVIMQQWVRYVGVALVGALVGWWMSSNNNVHLTSMSASSSQLPQHPAGCKRLLWFTGMSEQNNPEMYWRQMVVAMSSAREKAPSLQPILIWLSPRNARTRWFEQMGGIVISHNLTFEHRMHHAVEMHRQSKSWLAYIGAYARLDAPLLARQLREVFDPEVFELDYVLYTDIDVMFYEDVTSCDIARPRYLAYGGEAFRNMGSTNTGVIYMNVSAMLEERGELLEFADAVGWNTVAWDQGLLNDFFENRTEFLDDVFNWKVYWGKEAGIKILHFHGPKPAEACYQCWIRRVPGYEKDPACECANPNFPILFDLADKADGSTFMREADRLYRRHLGRYLGGQQQYAAAPPPRAGAGAAPARGPRGGKRA